jgi:hypothetical protein
MSKLIKKTAVVLIALSLLCAITLPSFALDLSFGDFQPVFDAEFSIMASGNGYHTQTIVFSGEDYSCMLSVAGNSTGARSVFSSAAQVTRDHGTVNASFDTINYGYVSASGGAISRFPNVQGYSESEVVPCPYGSSQVEGYRWVSATGTVCGTSFYCRAA